MVDYDSHTESIARSIPITLNKIDLQFLPEGGSFIEGLGANIAFKAIDEFGKPVDVKGVITNQNDQVVTSFESYKFGMGSFLFAPRPGDRIYGPRRITSPANIKTQVSPRCLCPPRRGVSIMISKNAGVVTVRFITTSPMEVRIVGTTKGIGYYSQYLQLNKGVSYATLRENLFPAGIAQFTLYGSGIQPLAERLIFLNSDKQLHVTISTNKPHYLPREKVLMTITTRDELGKPIPANFSLSVVDDKLWTLADDRQDNILSWLLMSSELQRPGSKSSAFYFKKEEAKAPLALDLVMLTNGYRYFDFIDQADRK